MIKVEFFETYGWEAAVRGMRNPMNSWDKSDSQFFLGAYDTLGPNDLDLMKRLRHGGADDRKFMRQIFVACDITAPLYWWKEADQYKVSTVTNSCSTMHKIAAKEFTCDDFSMEHLLGRGSDVFIDAVSYSIDESHIAMSPSGVFKQTIAMLNVCRDKYLETKEKVYWWQLIQLLPSSYNQKRTWTANYEVLANIYQARRNHKLDEWHDFCNEIMKLPYAKELIAGE